MARTKTKDAPATEPKWGARAKRRLADVKKDQGVQKAKTIESKAREIAVKKEDRTIRLEYVYEAEGTKMPDGAHSHYGKPNGGPFKEGASTTRKRGTAKTGTARKSGTAGQGNSRAAKRRTRKTAASAAGSQSPGKSKTDQMHEQREQAAAAAEKNEPETPRTPPEEEEPKTLA